MTIKFKICIYTILSLLIIFILISSISAADVNVDSADLTSLRGNDEIVGIQNEFDVLDVGTRTSSELSGEIGSRGNITLHHDYYTYDSCSTINTTITGSVIDGNSAVIDITESDVGTFKVDASGVTIKNLEIKNAKYSANNEINYMGTLSTVENCNFINNSVTGDKSYGGAIYLSDNSYGAVINCNNFIDSSSSCLVTNGNFTNNAPRYVGAVNKTSKNAAVINGEAKANFADLPAGVASKVNFGILGSAETAVNDTETPTVNKTDVAVNVTANPITIGEDAVIVISGLANAALTARTVASLNATSEESTGW